MVVAFYLKSVQRACGQPASGSVAASRPVQLHGPPIDRATKDIIGRYKLREKLGEGGCGAVYMALPEEPVRRKVALKIIKSGVDTRSVMPGRGGAPGSRAYGPHQHRIDGGRRSPL